MKPGALCDSALLCRGPIQNSLSHFNPPPPTTQRLRNSPQLSATRRSIYAWRRFHTNCCFSTSCRKELRSRNGIDLASLRLPAEGLAHFAPRFSQILGFCTNLTQPDTRGGKDVFMTAGQEEKSPVCK